MGTGLRAARRVLRPVLLRPELRRLPPFRLAWTHAARRDELAFWKANPQYVGDNARAWVYTDVAGIERGWYAGRRLLDVGCGPRGSLDWATDAARRVGLDPLAAAYVDQLGADAEAMEYVTGNAEAMPFESASFDWVGCTNALDHVVDPERAAAEMVRVLAPGGLFVLITDVAHEARLTEPQTFGWEVLDLFRAELEVVSERRLALVAGGTDAALKAALPHSGVGPGVLAALLRR